MILVEDILKLHRFSIEIYGGAAGVRDLGLLESAIAGLINHPFVDGNKRTGFLAIASLIQKGGFVFTIDISTGSKSFEEIVEWLKANSTSN